MRSKIIYSFSFESLRKNFISYKIYLTTIIDWTNACSFSKCLKSVGHKIVDAFERFIKMNGHRHALKSNASTQREKNSV